LNWKTSDIPVETLREASRRPEVIQAVRNLLDEVDRRIAAATPTCWNKGECCRFGRYGHRLYVTALEVVYYLAGPAGDAGPEVTEDTCPHARGGRCCAREHRPLGCRVFYCDPAAQAWQGPLTEEMLDRLRRMHTELGVPYLYCDWLTVLHALGERR
jgi:hypothetical protein